MLALKLKINNQASPTCLRSNKIRIFCLKQTHKLRLKIFMMKLRFQRLNC